MMWLDMATGFLGAMTLLFVARAALRHFGMLPSAEVRFAPKGGCQDAVVRELRRARCEVLVLAYRFCGEALVAALVDAKKRGANVEVILDAGNEKDRQSDLKALAEQGLDLVVDPSHPETLAQTIVIDGRTVVTGSYDFSPRGDEECAADVVILRGQPELAASYRQHFLAHKEHARPAQLKADGAAKKAA